MKLLSRFLHLTFLVLLAVSWAVPAQAGSPVVQAVLFYSPSCGHCHKVINEVLPPLREQYKDQLEIVMVDVTLDQGQVLYQSAIQALEIPDERLGVPTLIVGDTVLVGSNEIPEQFPGLIELGIEQGGVGLPEIPGMEEAIAQTDDQQSGTAGETDAGVASQPTSAPETGESLPISSAPGDLAETPAQNGSPEFVLRFLRDPVANSLAVLVLLGMAASVIGVGISFVNGSPTGIARWPVRILLPVLSLIGLGVAAYLTFVETTQTQAVCGPVGNCNAVQDSQYASILGIPVGLIGLAGYIGILAAWAVQYYGPQGLRRPAAIALWVMAWLGVLFSIYLTFLEPFVIGATCMWCLSSAIIMTLILWMATPAALSSMQTADEEPA